MPPSPALPENPSVQVLFNRIAPIYDQLNDRLSLGLHRVWKQMTVSWSGAAAGQVCLDVCCGSGDLARLLAQKVIAQDGLAQNGLAQNVGQKIGQKVHQSGQVVGLDFSTELLAIARQSTPPNLPITWVEADALQIPFPDHHFDAATMGYGLRNIPDIPASLRELRRVLKPGATVAILDFHRPQNPAMQAFQQWYLDNLVVPMATSFNLRAEYEYIFPSLQRFPGGREQVQLAKQAGFSQAVHYAIAADMMGVLVATK